MTPFPFVTKIDTKHKNSNIFRLSLSCLIDIMSYNSSGIRQLEQHQQERKRPSTYFDLIELVGDVGKYQIILVVLFSLVWFSTAVILLSTAFLFRLREFDCRANGLALTGSDCSDHVCKLPEDQWVNYLTSEKVDSIATADDNDLCDRSATIDLVSSSTYLGAFTGYLVISYLMDNAGRRKSFLISWAICLAGTILVAFSNGNLYLVALGMFCSGGGADSCLNLSLIILGEVTGASKRQRYSIVMMLLWNAGPVLVTLFFYLMSDWQINWIIVGVAPVVVVMIFAFLFLRQTPQFLVKEGVQRTVEVMNQIGKINKGIEGCVTVQDVEDIIEYQLTQNFEGKTVSLLDLCRFSSLRVTTICLFFLGFFSYAMYYAPTLIIGQFGFNIYLNNIIVTIADTLSLIPLVFYITRLPRRAASILLCTIAVTLALILVFVTVPDECDICFESVTQLVLIFIFRFCVASVFNIYQVYMCQLFPARVRGIGTGVVSAGGTVGSTISPIYLGVLRREGINVMLFFVVFGLIAIANLTLLNETLGQPMREEIEEVQMLKEHKRTQLGISQSNWGKHD